MFLRNRRPILKLLLLALLILTAGALIFHRPLLTYAARSLIVTHPLEKADIIIALSGESSGEREAHAADIWKAGYAPRILVAGCRIAWKTNEAECMKRHLLELGIPESAILMEKEGENTVQQATNIQKRIEPLGAESLILVTSPYHTRRALRLFRDVFGPEYRIISSPVQASRFRIEEWWTRSYDTRMVMSEFIKWVKAWLRLP
ncbi:MAG: YdcF family protein [Armatimonadetes bacterium]|nr:YdcF family protein [Armatimonadota bacterium]